MMAAEGFGGGRPSGSGGVSDVNVAVGAAVVDLLEFGN